MQQSFSTSSFDEKPSVQSLLGPRKESLSTAEVQLKILTSLQPLKWKVKATGVACFVKDFNRKGYYIEVFDMNALKSVYEQELQNDDGYRREGESFAQINGDNGIIGLSFISKIEANHFNGKIEERLSKRRSRTSYVRPSDSFLPSTKPKMPPPRKNSDYRRKQEAEIQKSEPTTQSSISNIPTKEQSADIDFKNKKPTSRSIRRSPQRRKQDRNTNIEKVESTAQSPRGSPMSQKRQGRDNSDSDDSESKIGTPKSSPGNRKKKVSTADATGSTWGVTRVWKKKEKVKNKPSLAKYMIGVPKEESFVHLQGVDIESSDKSSAFHQNPLIKEFLTKYGLEHWLLDPNKASQVEEWAVKNDFYGKAEEAKIYKGGDFESKNNRTYNLVPKPPPPPFPKSQKPLPPTPTNQDETEQSSTEIENKLDGYTATPVEYTIGHKTTTVANEQNTLDGHGGNTKQSKLPPPPCPIQQKPYPLTSTNQVKSEHNESEIQNKTDGQSTKRVEGINNRKTSTGADEGKNRNTVSPAFLQELSRNINPQLNRPKKYATKEDSNVDKIAPNALVSQGGHDKSPKASPPPLPIYRKPMPPAPKDDSEEEEETEFGIEKKLDRLSARWIEENRNLSLLLNKDEEENRNNFQSRFPNDIFKHNKPVSNTHFEDDTYEDLTYSSDEQEQIIYTYDSDWDSD